MENTKNQTKNKSPGQPSREQDEVVVHREIITRGESVFSANTLDKKQYCWKWKWQWHNISIAISSGISGVNTPSVAFISQRCMANLLVWQPWVTAANGLPCTGLDLLCQPYLSRERTRGWVKWIPTGGWLYIPSQRKANRKIYGKTFLR